MTSPQLDPWKNKFIQKFLEAPKPQAIPASFTTLQSPVQIYRVWLIEITVDNLMSPGDFLDSHACPRRSGTGQKVKESRRKVLACWALHHQCFVYSTMRILVEDKIQETLFFKHYWINLISFSELSGLLYKYLPNSDVNFGLENSLWRARG